MVDTSPNNLFLQEYANFLTDFEIDPSIFPEDDNFQDLWIADFFSSIPDDVSISSFEGARQKRKSDDKIISLCDDIASLSPLSSETKRSKLPKELSTVDRKLDPKLINFITLSTKLLSENNLEALEMLIAATTLPDIKVNVLSPGFQFEDIGMHSLFRFYGTIEVIFPDFILTEGNLRLAEDKGGMYLITNFHFTGTRTVQTPFDYMFFNEAGLLGQLDRSGISAEKMSQLKEIEQAQKENKKMSISAVGIRKYYIDVGANKFRSVLFEWKVADIEVNDGGKIVLLPFTMHTSSK